MGRNRQPGREMCWGLGSAAVDDPGQDLGGAEAAGEFRIVREEGNRHVPFRCESTVCPGSAGFTLSFHRRSILSRRRCRHVFKGGEIARGHPFPRRNRSGGWIWARSPLDTLLGGRGSTPSHPCHPNTTTLGLRKLRLHPGRWG